MPQQPTFRVQIGQIDYSLVSPGSLDNSSLTRVPVIRVYGPTSTGKKACVHIHQVYPYFFVEYKGTLTPECVRHYIYKLAYSLNHAIALSYRQSSRMSNTQYIRAIFLVKGVHFYGFNPSYSPFLKIYLTDPAYTSRAATILQSGSVLNTRFRVFESHLSYLLQFMCDFGLYGCGWLEATSVLQRFTHDTEVSDVDEFAPSPYFRQSCMPLEFDIVAPQILNRLRISARGLHQGFEKVTPTLPPEPLVLGVRELWDDERQRRRARGLNPSPEVPLDPSDSSREPNGAWVAEVRWWEELRSRIERERQIDTLELKVTTNAWERSAMTTFESIEALWESPWKVWKPAEVSESVGHGTNHSHNSGESWQTKWDGLENLIHSDFEEAQVDVDVSMIFSQEISQMIEEEETDWVRLMGHGDQHSEDEEPGHDETEHESEYEFDNVVQNDGPTTNGVDEYPKGSTGDQGGSTGDPLLPVNSYLDPPPVVEPTRPGPETLSTSLTLQGISKMNIKKAEVSAHKATTRQNLEEILAPAQSESNKISPHLTFNKLQKSSMGSVPPEFIDDSPMVKQHRPGFSVLDSMLSSPSPFTTVRVEPTRLPHKTIRPRFDFRTMRTLNLNRYMYIHAPPTVSDLVGSIDDNGIAAKVYNPPYYSKYNDIPERPREYAGLIYHININIGDMVSNLEEWATDLDLHQIENPTKTYSTNFEDIVGWEYAGYPPSPKQVKVWLASQKMTYSPKNKLINSPSQVESPDPANIREAKGPLHKKPEILRERQGMSLLSLEVFAPTQDGKIPDATIDRIVSIFYSYQASEGKAPRNGALVVQTSIAPFFQQELGIASVEWVTSELDLLNTFIDIVVELDPDIVVGWEVERLSWGYLNARGRHYGFDVAHLISRAPAVHSGSSDQWMMRHTSSLKVSGRHVFNLWRIMRSEFALTSYTFENVVFHTLQKRIPHYSISTVSRWYHDDDHGHSIQVMLYYLNRVVLTLEIIEKSEIVTKTAEFARVFGVDFFSVISRGSQFKVESFMFRIAKPESFVLISPSRLEVGKQNAAECMPLIMEPLSGFYSSPLVVLDFQSLYPSVMIAYNYCYSTCLGRVKEFKGKNKLGVMDLDQPPGLVQRLSDHIRIAPNGIMYVKPEVRKGLLGRMLVELLETRVMIKQALKGVTNEALRRVLDARQLGLKYIANVTYGYTSATYSGRMPAVEIADSIVQSGRETLEKAIMLIDKTEKWGAQVVYGDTDSIFVYLRGKTKEQAFRIGNDIADTITSQNPSPVKMKFEKVYLPCVLIAKKRYVGFKYEHVDDQKPVFDAKGIETVRRDGVFAQRKLTENCLKILFRTQNLSKVKDYCYRTWTEILENKASVQDFIFAKEIRMGTYSEKGPPPPGVTMAAQRMLVDPNNEPQYGERVPYVIIRGPPGSRLVDRAIDPLEFLQDSQLHLDANYYILRVLIPPLQRIFNLLGADVHKWFVEMPKLHSSEVLASPTKAKDGQEILDPLNIDEHFHNSQCVICGEIASQGLCDECYMAPQETLANLASRIQVNERGLANAQHICATCTGSRPGDEIRCESLDCPWLYSRKRMDGKEEFLISIQEIMDGLNERVETNTLIEAESSTSDGSQVGSSDEESSYYHIESLRFGL